MHRLKALASATMLGLAASAVAVVGGVTPAAGAATTAPVRVPAVSTSGAAHLIGQSKLHSVTSSGTGSPNTSAEDNKTIPELGGGKPKISPSKMAHPLAAQTSFGTGTPAAQFQGVNHWQQSIGSRRTVDCSTVTGGPYTGDTCTATNYSFEPPDQMMCTGGSGGGTATPAILEGVNDATAVFNAAGTETAGPMTINDMVPGMQPEEILVINSSGSVVHRVYGSDVATDPRCNYDSGTGRYYMIFLDLKQNPGVDTGGYTGQTWLYFAVSAANDPTTWTWYGFDVSDDGAGGTPTHPNCPCLGDQPLMGFNADALYFATNEYPFIPGGPGRGYGLNGAQIYVFDKHEMGAGAWHFVQMDEGTVQPSYTMGNGTSCPTGSAATNDQLCTFYTVQPATTAPGVTDPSTNEYFLSAGDFTGQQTGAHSVSGDNVVFTWQLHGTDAYNTSCATTCNGSLLNMYQDITTVGGYSLPPNEMCQGDTYYNPGTNPDFWFNNCATQAPARVQYLPLAQQCWKIGGPAPCPEAGLATNDDRMNQVMEDGSGNLWAGLNTDFYTETSTGLYQTAGIHWFEITPLVNGTSSSALVNSGYTGSRFYDVMFPSIEVGPNGHAVMSFDLSGQTIFPGQGYQVLGTGASPGGVVITYTAPRPEDGFAAYELGYQRPRWGDYTSGVVGLNGSIWFAGEVTSLQRTTLANWSTQITSIAAP